MKLMLPPQHTLVGVNKVVDFVDKCVGYDYVAFDTETNTLHGTMIGLSLAYWNGSANYCYVPLTHNRMEKLEALKPIFNDEHRTLIGHNIKYDMHAMKRSGVDVTTRIWDTFVAAWMLDENRDLGLKSLVGSLLGKKMTEYSDLVGKGHGKLKTSLEIPLPQLSQYAMDDAHYTYKLFQIFRQQLNDENLIKGFNLLMDVTRVLYNMEQRGILVDVAKLKQISLDMEKEIIQLSAQIWKAAGEKFDIGSNAQLGKILFKKHKLTPLRKSAKTNVPSVDVETLKALQHKSKLCALMVKYRETTKLRNTYADGLVKHLDKNGCVHTNYKIGGTITGRLSSTKPNLQNIPIRSVRGKEIRQCFIARPGYRFIVADYHNIELRLLAHFSRDPLMCDAYIKNENLHLRTAIEILGANPTGVTPTEKARAKAVNFGLMYGMGPKSLAKHLGCDYNEAYLIYQRYFQVFGNIPSWKNNVIAYCQQKGYVLTLLGRKRHIPNILHQDKELRARAERQAVNSKIQGSCSDIVNLAMRNMDQHEHEGCKQLLQVHDELVIESDNVERDIPLVQQSMEMQLLRVPTVVEICDVERWGDAK